MAAVTGKPELVRPQITGACRSSGCYQRSWSPAPVHSIALLGSVLVWGQPAVPDRMTEVGWYHEPPLCQVSECMPLCRSISISINFAGRAANGVLNLAGPEIKLLAGP